MTVSASPLPAVDRVLQEPAAVAAIAVHGRKAMGEAVRAELDRLRSLWRSGAAVPNDPAGVADSAASALAKTEMPTQRPVINLTGTVLHTNLGRAVLADPAIAAALAVMGRPSNLEYDLGSGERGERDDHVRDLIRDLTGAADVCLVNNNAAALLLVLATFARDRGAIVSRGELIEIGGAFRIPEIMRQAGARLVEVGTTNRTHLRDFEAALDPDTGLLLKVHTSNYVVQGFTAEVPGRALAGLAAKAGVPYVEDLGSGTLVDLSRYGLPRERTVSDVLGEGADLVTFSGDKLLGGPQAGFIAGRADLVRACAKNHLKRALRLDKLRLAALEATLRLYRDPDRLAERLPTLRYFGRDRADIRAQADRIAPAFAAALGGGWSVAVIDCASQIGSGALPVDSLPSAGLALRPLARSKGSALAALAARLRALPLPVIGRVHDDALILDLRCLDDEAGLLAQLPPGGLE